MPALECSAAGICYEWLGLEALFAPAEDPGTETPAAEPASVITPLGLDSLYHLIRSRSFPARASIRHPDEQDEHPPPRAGVPASHDQLKTRAPHRAISFFRFSFDKPDTAWVGDITAIPTGEGYRLCACEDAASRSSLPPTTSTQISSRCALRVAVQRLSLARPHLPLRPRRQYAATYRQRLASLGIQQSMSRKGDPYDNAVAKRFFSCLGSAVRPSAILRLRAHAWQTSSLISDLLQPSAAFLYSLVPPYDCRTEKTICIMEG